MCNYIVFECVRFCVLKYIMCEIVFDILFVCVCVCVLASLKYCLTLSRIGVCSVAENLSFSVLHREWVL